MALVMSWPALGAPMLAGAEAVIVDRRAPGVVGQARMVESMRSKLAVSVVEALRRDSIVDLRTLDVSTHDGVVTLIGSQAHLLACDRATYIAETVPGVRRVIDRLKVRQAREADTQKLESDTLYALLTDPATAHSSIDVAASASGRVVLSGAVASYPERQLAERVIRGVIGVTAVSNNIEIADARRLSDRQLADDVRQALAWDAYIDGASIDVSVDHGVVTLAGEVDTAAQRRRSVGLSWAMGAKSVDDTRLELTNGSSLTPTRNASVAARFVTDANLAAMIRRALRADPRVRDSPIEVSVQNRAVTFVGSVDNLLAKRVAGALANNMRGVASIDNRLRVPSEAQVFTDAEIEARIERSLERNSATCDAAIGVSVLDAAVTLEGETNNWLARQTAENAAASIRGVHKVSNEIVVATEMGTPSHNSDFDTTQLTWIAN